MASKLLVLVAGILLATQAGSAQQVGREKIRAYVTDSASWQISGSSGASADAAAGQVSGGARPQTAEIIKTFNERCPDVTITNRRDRADYVVLLDHEEGKTFIEHRNKIALFNHNGDAIFSHSTLSLGNSVKDACEAIHKDQSASAQKP